MSSSEPRLFRENVGCMRFEDKNILVTAGTLGIGRAIVERLCQEGAYVFLCSRKEKNVKETVDELKAKGYKVGGTTCNVGKPEELQKFIEEGLIAFGSDVVHGVVLNAAVNPMAGGTFDMPSGAYDKVMNVNVKANFEFLKLVRPRLRSGSSIILVSSTGGLNPSPPLGIYAVSKSALISLGRVLSKDLGPDGIRVNCLAPGLTKTKFSTILWEGENGKRALNLQALQRIAEPEDMAGAAAFLLSQDSAMMTGETIVISGGVSTRL